MNMGHLPDSNLVYVPADDGSDAILLNVELIRMVDEIRNGHCRVWFSETHQVSLHGKGADQIIVLLGSRAILTDGGRSTTLSEIP